MIVNVSEIYLPTSEYVVLAALDGWCFNMEIAPRSPSVRTPHGYDVIGYYLQLFCPDECVADRPEGAICVGWWEPHQHNDRGMWIGEGSFELHPVAWRYLPKPPAWDFENGRRLEEAPATVRIPLEGVVS